MDCWTYDTEEAFDRDERDVRMCATARFWGDADDEGDAHFKESTEQLREHHQKHRCTDILCVLIFMFTLSGVFWVLGYASTHGDMRKLYNGYNFEGQLCGIDTPGEFLYWCQDPAQLGILDLVHPICVDSCPSGSETSNSCFNDLTGSFVDIPDYEAMAFAGRYCMPTEGPLMSQVSSALKGNSLARLISGLSETTWAWVPLLVSAVFAFFLGYLYLFFLFRAACCIVWACMVIMVVVPLCAGGYLVSWSLRGNTDNLHNIGDMQWMFTVGMSSFVLGVILLLIAAFRKRSINTAVHCIEAACECMWDMPSLLVEPFVTLFFKCSMLTLMSIGFLWMLSAGKVTHHGLYRSFSYDVWEKRYIAYYFFMMIWVNDLCDAMSHFVLAYAVQLWYFSPIENDAKVEVPSLAIFRGYRVGLLCHIGTLAFGAVIIAVVRSVRMALAYAEKLANDTYNCAAACIAKAFLCCFTCIQNGLEFLNKNAYIDVAITSSNFCSAASRATLVVSSEMTAVSALNGACWIVQLAGLGAITGLGSVASWLLVTRVGNFSDPNSPSYVHDPVFLTLVAAVISFLVAFIFMIVFDTVSDSILYCYALEKRRHRGRTENDGEPVPRGLMRLVAQEGRVLPQEDPCMQKSSNY